MARIILAIAACGMFAACAAPAIDHVKWRCDTHADCGSGWLCEAATHSCVKAASGGTDGIYDDRVVFGMVAPVTAGSAGDVVIGQSVRTGIEAYFKHANDSGGINGRRLELRVLDDGGDAQRAIEQARTLTQSGILALLGALGNVSAAALVPEALAERTLLFGAVAGGAELRPTNPTERYVINYRASDLQEITALTAYLAERRFPAIPPANIALFTETDDRDQLNPVGRSAEQSLKSALAQRYAYAKPPLIATYRRQSLEVAAAVGTVLRWLGSGELEAPGGGAPSAAMLVASGYKPGATFIRTLLDAYYGIRRGLAGKAAEFGVSSAQEANIKTIAKLVFVATSSAGSNVLAGELGLLGTVTTDDGVTKVPVCQDVVISQVVPPPASSTAGVSQYRTHMEALVPDFVPCHLSLEGYVIARLLGQALERHPRDINAESFIDAIEGLGTIDLGLQASLELSTQRHQASDHVWGSRIDETCALQPLDFAGSGGVEPGPAACATSRCPLSGVIAKDATLTSDKTWVLMGKVSVGTEGAPVVLNVERGTTIVGDATTRGMLVISRGSRLEALGEVDRPIVFTSSRAAGSRARGDWGGVVVNGKARVNCPSGGTCEVPGAGATGTYGGAADADNSGTLRYVRIEFAGAELSEGEYAPGLWLRGVGSGTTIDYVQVNRAMGAGLELAGGTVDLKHVQATASGRIGLRWSEGWRGKAQFVLIRQSGDVDAEAAIEGLNRPEAEAAVPRSSPQIYNATLVGKPRVLYGLRLASGTRALLRNVIALEFGSACVDIDGVQTWGTGSLPVGDLSLADSILYCGTLTPVGETDPATDDVTKYLTDENRLVDPQLENTTQSGSIDLRPKAGSPALTGAATPPEDGFFDKTATYVGALKVGDNWDVGWTTDAHD